MTKTNQELARHAAIKVLDVFDLDEIEQVIRVTYAEAMAENDEMRDLIEEILAYCGEPLYRHRPKWAEAMKRVENMRQLQQPKATK